MLSTQIKDILQGTASLLSLSFVHRFETSKVCIFKVIISQVPQVLYNRASQWEDMISYGHIWTFWETFFGCHSRVGDVTGWVESEDAGQCPNNAQDSHGKESSIPKPQ